MGMDSFVVGVIPPDEKFKRMKGIYDDCREMAVEIPKEVVEFFGDEAPDEAGRIVDVPCKAYYDDCVDGLEVDLSKVPKDVKIIRFVNSY